MSLESICVKWSMPDTKGQMSYDSTHVVPREVFIETKWWLAYPEQIGIGNFMVKKFILMVMMGVSECMCGCWAATYEWVNGEFYVMYIFSEWASSVRIYVLTDVYYFILCYISTEELHCFPHFPVRHLRSHSFFRDLGRLFKLKSLSRDRSCCRQGLWAVAPLLLLPTGAVGEWPFLCSPLARVLIWGFSGSVTTHTDQWGLTHLVSCPCLLSSWYQVPRASQLWITVCQEKLFLSLL